MFQNTVINNMDSNQSNKKKTVTIGRIQKKRLKITIKESKLSKVKETSIINSRLTI